MMLDGLVDAFGRVKKKKNENEKRLKHKEIDQEVVPNHPVVASRSYRLALWNPKQFESQLLFPAIYSHHVSITKA